jgi:uncharacterized membrane protein
VIFIGLALYAVAAHLGLAYGNPWPALSMLLILLGGAALQAWRHGARIRAVVSIAAAGGLALLALNGLDTMALYLPPLAIALALLLTFAGSLRAGHTPLVTRIARLMDGEQPPEVARYTRRVTVTWAWFLGLMNLELWLLALLAPPTVWSMFANGINYALLLLFFAAEYAVRQRVLAHLPHPGLLAFLRRLAAVRLSRAA